LEFIIFGKKIFQKNIAALIWPLVHKGEVLTFLKLKKKFRRRFEHFHEKI
jgi:hypothetical protein